MHWSDEIAKQIIERKPDKEVYTCAAGYSPSGSGHIGNFRDIATSLFVAKALERQGKKARLLLSWDEFDRMRKVPANVAALPDTADLEDCIGKPYVDVRNPFHTEAPTYAAYFEQEFQAAIERFGIHMEYRHQARLYRSGAYRQEIQTALAKRLEIFDILDSMRTQDAAEGEREAYYPVSIYCPVCGKDSTKITSLDRDCRLATYECACGYHGTFDFDCDTNCKLGWKIDWAMRWMYEGVDFEPGGKDHASPTGSYQTSRQISKLVYGYEAPVFQGYEFIGIKGLTGKMSGSSGLNLTPDAMLKLYEPEVILWLYAKTEPTKAFDFCFDDGILRQYAEFDRMLEEYRSGKAADFTASVMDSCLIPGREVHTVPMSLLVQLGSIVDFNVPMLETVFAKIGTPYTYDQFKERLDRARYWLEQCAPEQVNRLRTTRNFEVYQALSAEEKQEISLLHQYLAAGGYSLEELNTFLYAIPKQVYGEDKPEKELKTLQGAFFKTVYRLLIDKERGPRLYLFLYAIDPERYVKLLDFSTPRTEAEAQADAQADADALAAASGEQTPVVAEKVYGDPDPVDPISTEEVSLDQFHSMDMRVCKILKCQEIRKSHNCYKLTLFDGIGERVIVSSIKHDYTPEELVGRKIIVLANLTPARFTGVTSNGMLLAATNSACGCQVIFVDDRVPEGTRIH
jgi:lysyl-tRNA synthetase class 1